MRVQAIFDRVLQTLKSLLPPPLNIRNSLSILLIAFSYFVSARFSLFLTPYNFSSPIFPAAGIAFAALWILGLRFWPAIFLGSVLFNSPIYFFGTPYSFDAWNQILGVVLVATGAVLQSIVGVIVVRKFVENPLHLTNEKKVFKFLILIGPIVSTISPTWGWWLGYWVGKFFFSILFF
jgi:integral membrane sensor domain MASE1